MFKGLLRYTSSSHKAMFQGDSTYHLFQKILVQTCYNHILGTIGFTVNTFNIGHNWELFVECELRVRCYWKDKGSNVIFQRLPRYMCYPPYILFSSFYFSIEIETLSQYTISLCSVIEVLGTHADNHIAKKLILCTYRSA